MTIVAGLILWAGIALTAGEAQKPAPALPAADHPSTATAAAAPATTDTLSAFYGQEFKRGPSLVKKIALSFDDGPSGATTPQVIEILKKEKVPATFFMLGESVQKNPEMAQFVAKEGFEIGCHTINHPKLTTLGIDQIRAEIGGSADLIEKATGKRPHLFRPPFGVINANVRTVCAENQLVIVNWSMDPRDWNPKATPESVLQATLKQAHGGGVVCIHDTHKKTVAALPRMISELRAKGYEFTTVGDMIAEAGKHKAEMPSMGGMVDTASEATPMASKPAAISLDRSAVK